MELANTTQILIRYSYQGVQYFIVSRNNKMFAVCYENKKIRMNFKPYETDLALKVYSAFLVDEKTSIKVDSVRITNNEYIIFYDTKHRNYYWKNKNPELPNNPSDNAILNMKYNNQTGIHYSSSQENSSKKFLKKVIFFGCISVIALASITMPLIQSSNNITISYEDNGTIIFNEKFFDLTEKEKISKYKEILYDVNKSDNESVIDFLSNIFQPKSGETAEYDSKIIQEAISRNENLLNQEKDFLYNFLPILEEHKEYINFELIAVRLNILNILYPQLNMSITGEYDEVNNVISMFNSNNKMVSNFQEADKLILTHEIGHVLSQGDNYGIIQECSNETWSRALIDKLYTENKVSTGTYSKAENGEYVIQGEGGYEGYLPFYYLLTQFMTTEEILQYQYSPNLDIIGNALIRTEKNIESNADNSKIEERAYSLLSKLDNKFENQAGIYPSNIASYALKELDYYYKIKNNKSLFDDLNMFLVVNRISSYYANTTKPLEENDPIYYKQNYIAERKKVFLQILKEELVKKNLIDNNEKFDVKRYFISYPDIFFKESNKNNMLIYIKATIHLNDNQPKEVSLELDITPDICEKFEKMCNEITKDIEK